MYEFEHVRIWANKLAKERVSVSDDKFRILTTSSDAQSGQFRTNAHNTPKAVLAFLTTSSELKIHRSVLYIHHGFLLDSKGALHPSLQQFPCSQRFDNGRTSLVELCKTIRYFLPELGSFRQLLSSLVKNNCSISIVWSTCSDKILFQRLLVSDRTTSRHKTELKIELKPD